jgi:UDP-2-acetamido-2-deoxy-ribo-hexuluronate aminotransferase
MIMNMDFANLKLQYQKYQNDIDKKIKAVLSESNYIMGAEITELESSLEIFTGAKYAISCSSGTDALTLSMMSIDIQPDDEIITTPFSFISTAETIVLMKAKPVFVDIEPDTFNIDATKIESAITKKTKAIIPVSLFGQPSDLSAIQLIAKKYNLKVIIDGAQSFGSFYNGKMDSSLGDISTTSFFPAKPFGCYGDGGAIFTNNDEYAEKLKMLRVHGQNKRYEHKYIGIAGRLDTIQAAILLAKLPYFKQELAERQYVADNYSEALYNYFPIPTIKPGRSSTWAQYTIRTENRSNIQLKLKEKGIPTAVHYPIPLHFQECFQYLNYKKGDFPVAETASNEVLSLPINAFMQKDIGLVLKNLIKLA